MNHHMRISLVLVALSLVLLLCAACGSVVVGDWRDGDGSTWTFTRQGTVTISGGLLAMSGDYRLEDNHIMRIEFGGLLGLAGPQIYKYSVSGPRLTLTDSTGSSIILTK